MAITWSGQSASYLETLKRGKRIASKMVAVFEASAMGIRIWTESWLL